MGITPKGDIPDTRRPCPVCRWKHISSWHSLFGHILLDKGKQIDSRCASSIVMKAVVFAPIAIVAHAFHHQCVNMGKSTKGAVEAGGFHVKPNSIAMVFLPQPGKGIVAAYCHPRCHWCNNAARFFVSLQSAFEPCLLHLPQGCFPFLKTSHILKHLTGGRNRLHFDELPCLSIRLGDDFACFIQIGTFCYNKIAKLHLLPVTCTDAGHGRKT